VALVIARTFSEGVPAQKKVFVIGCQKKSSMLREKMHSLL